MYEELNMYDLIVIRDSLRESAAYMTRDWDPIQEDYKRLIDYFTNKIIETQQQ